MRQLARERAKCIISELKSGEFFLALEFGTVANDADRP